MVWQDFFDAYCICTKARLHTRHFSGGGTVKTVWDGIKVYDIGRPSRESGP